MSNRLMAQMARARHEGSDRLAPDQDSDFCQRDPTKYDRRPTVSSYRGVQILLLVHRATGCDAWKVRGQYYPTLDRAKAAIDSLAPQTFGNA